MPTVVFEINGKMYPLTPSAYTNQVCISREEPGFTKLSSSWELGMLVIRGKA